MTEPTMPQGVLLIQTLAMPVNTNANGDIFGGWLVAQMDLAAGVFAKKESCGRAVTVAIHELTFFLPVHVGDLLSCYVRQTKQGNTSMTLVVEAWKETFMTADKQLASQGTFVFVALDSNGRPRQVRT